MEKTLQDLGDLVLSAVPTAILLIFLWIYLRFVLFQPIAKTLAERDAATKGATEQAGLALKRAEEKAAEYEAQLRAARGEILRAQDAERKRLRQDQVSAVAAAREKTRSAVESARREIESEAQAARQSLREEAQRLSGAIVASVLKGSPN
jgi:F-type H+-transporting ATPase subunit b